MAVEILPPLRAIRFHCVLCCAECRELQRVAGDRPFPLDCRTAGRLVNVPYKTANRWLTLLECDKLLTLIQKGSFRSGKANHYRCMGSLEE